MNVTSMSDAQRQALLDLFVLGMYCDRHLALSEDQRINRLLDQFLFESDYDRDRTLDATISRLSPLVSNENSLRSSIEEASNNFDSAEMRKAVYTALVQLLESDKKTNVEEARYLQFLRNALWNEPEKKESFRD